MSRAISGATFTKSGGCGDVFVWATTTDDTMAITVEWAGAASEAWDDDGFEETAALPQQQIRVQLVVGQRLSETYCTDIMFEGPRVDGEASAVSGVVELEIRPDAGGFKPSSHADVTLRDIGFEITFGSDDETWVVDQLELTDIQVGWLAG